jgi:alkylation response protein AidB-like acyl-CoA dehydrogenase
VATVDAELGHRGQASFVVAGDNPGLKLGSKESKLGIRASQTAEILLEECRVPGDALLGGEEKLQKKLERARSGQSSGKSGALATFEITRPTVGASAIGIAQAAYEWTLQYLAGRSEDGTPLLEQQRIQQVLADVATEIEASRLLIWRAAWMGRNGVPMTGGQGSMSKLKGGDVTMWATTTLMDLVGDYAQSTDCPLEKWFRDAKIYQIFEGTAQIQRLVVARMQVADYAERLGYAKEVADKAMAPGNGAATNGTHGASEKAARDAAAAAVA